MNEDKIFIVWKSCKMTEAKESEFLTTKWKIFCRYSDYRLSCRTVTNSAEFLTTFGSFTTGLTTWNCSQDLFLFFTFKIEFQITPIGSSCFFGYRHVPNGLWPSRRKTKWTGAYHCQLPGQIGCSHHQLPGKFTKLLLPKSIIYKTVHRGRHLPSQLLRLLCNQGKKVFLGLIVSLLACASIDPTVIT